MVYSIDYIIFIFALLVLGLSSAFDIKSREVPQFLLYILIFGSVLLCVFKFIFTGSLSSIEYLPVSLALLFGFSYLMYISGQWAAKSAECR